MFRSIWLALLVIWCCPWRCTQAEAEDDVSRIKSDEQVIFFPTIGHRSEDGRSWLMPIHGWIFEPEESDRLRRAVVRTFFDAVQLDPGTESAPIFRDRMRLFLVDNERGKRIQIKIASKVHTLQASAADGHITDTVRIQADLAEHFEVDRVLEYRVTAKSSETRRFGGQVYCLPSEGITVISDIDDTIKVTEVRDKKQVLRNTFLREFRAVEGMSGVYQRWAKSDVHFHYLSASPWQLYPPLSEFIVKAGFPAATIQLKQIRLKDTTFFDLFADPVNYKLSAIEPILAAYPKRRLVLVGDSGEKDPETYGVIARQNPSQILRIYIRDVTGDKTQSERYREAFADVSAEKWQVFRDPTEIKDALVSMTVDQPNVENLLAFEEAIHHTFALCTKTMGSAGKKTKQTMNHLPDGVLASPCPTSQTELNVRLIHDAITGWLKRERGFEVESIDYDGSLFEFGVDSMGVAEITNEIEQLTGKRLAAEEIFELETINELATYVDSLQTYQGFAAEVDTVPPAAPIGDDGAGDLFEHYRRLNRRVTKLKEDSLYFFEPEISEHDDAWVVAEGQRMLMLGSYEYLGLLGHSHLKQTSIEAIEKYGTGHHGVRLLAGTTTVHRQLESRLARFMQAEQAIVYSSGYVTNLATISTLVGPGDCVIGDQWNHASIIDGCRMSGAEFLEFTHNDMDSLAEKLAHCGSRRKLVVVDAVFSMDGDIVDLPAVIDLCRQHNALLMVDEAHSIGVLGKTGRGIQEHFNLDADDIDIKMGTLSKTLAGCGGFVAAKEEVVTYLRHHARGYIFSGALPSGQASVAIAALDVIEREPELVTKLQANQEYYLAGLKALGFDTAKSVTPIVPIMTQTTDIALAMTRICRTAGLFVIPVCYPAVPMDAPRLRTCVSAIHSTEDIDFALDVLARAGKQTGLLK